MSPDPPRPLQRLLTVLAGALILKVFAAVIVGERSYFPPDFSSDFLRGREPHFHGPYRWAFFAHIISGPASLLLGLILIAEWHRARFPAWHRHLGRVQVASILLLVTPSGLVMAYHAAAGPVAAAGLAALAIATAVSASLGTRAAIGRRFADHRRWMWRCYLLIASAVVLRMIGGLATVTGLAAAWVDPPATWLSWLVPLAVFEVRERVSPRGRGLTGPG